MTIGGVRRLLPALTLLGFAAMAPVAHAGTAVVGEVRLASNGPTVNTFTRNVPVFQGDASGNYDLAVPVAGTIASWGFMSGGVTQGNQFVLRVLRPDDQSGMTWTAVGTSAPEAVVDATGVDGVEGPFATSLPVQPGDRIALEPITDGQMPLEAGVNGEDGYRTFTAPLADGSSGSIDPGQASDAGQVVPVQATITTTPSPPTVAITTPAAGAAYGLGQTVLSSFSCSEGAGGPGIASCVDQNGHPTGSPLDTSTVHSHILTVTATSLDGQTTTGQASYTVGSAGGSPPSAALTQRTVNGRLVLDASGSRANGSPIAGYTIRFGHVVGLGITCGANSPVVEPVFTHTVAGTADLTVTAANGTSTSIQVSFTAPGVASVLDRAHVHTGSAAAGAAGAAGSGIPAQLIAYQCLPSSGITPGDFVGEAAGVSISADCELDAGIVQIDGCGLRSVNDLCTGVPVAERMLVEAHVVKQTGLKLATGPCGDHLSTGLLGTIASDSVTQQPRNYRFLDDAFYVSKDPVRINGLDFFPQHGGTLVVATGGLASTRFAPFSAYVVSSDVAVKLGGFPLPIKPKLDLDVSNVSVLHPDTPCANGPPVNDLRLGQFQLQDPFNLPTFLRVINSQNPGTPLASLPSLPVTGAMTVSLTAHGGSDLSINVALNRVLDDPKDPDGNFTGCTVLAATNDTGVDVDHFEIVAPQIDVGVPVQFKFVYDRPTRSFSGSIAVEPPGAQGQIGGSIDFLNGVFADAGLNFTADPGGGYPLGAGFFMIKIDGKFYLFQRAIPGSQTAIQGDMRVSYGPAINNNGCGLIDAEGDARLALYPGPFSLDAILSTEVYCYPVTSRYFHIDGTGLVEVGITTGFNFGPVGLTANLDGQGFYDGNGLPRLQLDGSGSGFVDFPDPIGRQSVGFTATISDRGAGFCGSLGAFGHTFDFGLGESFVPPPINELVFLNNLSFMFDGCNLSKYQSLPPGGPPTDLAGDARARPAYTASVARATPNTELVLKGEGAPPSVTLRGPGGRTVDTATNQLSKGILVVREPGANVTFVELAAGEAGQWAITMDPGSAAIERAVSARVLPAPKITASVTGSGARHVLHYRITAPAGARVTFLERGHRGGELIGAAQGAQGSIAFTPSEAVTGTRTIIAAITENGMPAPALTVVHYRAVRPVPGRPAGIAITRRHGGIVVSFRAAARADSYYLAISLSDGRGLRQLLTGKGTSFFVSGVGPRIHVLRVSVYGMRDGVAGPRATRRY